MKEIIYEAGSRDRRYWMDVFRYKDLFVILAWRDLTVRYKQTAIGIIWALIRPALTMGIFVIIFQRIAKMPSDGNAPYPILVFAAMLPWQFFSSSLSESSNSLLTNSNLISKVYFPRLIIPASSVITGLVDFAVSLLILFLMMAFYNYWPDWRILLLPLFTCIAFLAAFGAGLWLCALNVKYRDFRYIVPFMVQIGLYISPVGFSSSVIPLHWRLFFSLNPMVGVIDGFRWALLHGDALIYWPALAMSLLSTVLLCLCGIYHFKKMESTLADVI